MPHPASIPFCSRFVFVTNKSSPTNCTFFPSSFVICSHPSQSSSSSGSSIEAIGYFSHKSFQWAINSFVLIVRSLFGKWYSPVFFPFHSLEAASKASTKSFSGTYPAFLTDSKINSIVSASLARSGAKPPSSPTEVVSFFSFNSFCNVWYTSQH